MGWLVVKKDAEERFIAIGVTFWKFYVVETCRRQPRRFRGEVYNNALREIKREPNETNRGGLTMK